MIDEQIIKALECCMKHQYICDKDCPLYECENEPCDLELMRKCLDLIDRQKKEIERLELERARNTYYVGSRGSGKTYQSMARFINIYELAIKRFAEQLKSRNHSFKTADGIIVNCIPFDYIDNLVKEMVGD